MSGLVVVRCPSCSQKYRIPASAIGRRARCKKCQVLFAIGPRQEASAEDLVVSWITEDDPSSQSVMGATGIFQNPADVPAAAIEQDETDQPTRAAPVAAAEPGVVLRKVDLGGAHFEFPAPLLASPTLRNAFPRRCIGCGETKNLRVHLIHWPEHMEVHDSTQWTKQMNSALARLSSFHNVDEPALLKQLPRTRHDSELFCLPFPVFACEYCQVARELKTHVVNHGPEEVCQMTIGSLAMAVVFFRSAGGRRTPEYQRLIEERDARRDPWRDLDPQIRQRINKWLTLQTGEGFVGFFPEADSTAQETGASGLALTNHRLVFKRYAINRNYPLDEPGRIEISVKGGQVAARIYEQGHQPSTLRLDQTVADELMATLRQMNCRWTLVT